MDPTNKSLFHLIGHQGGKTEQRQVCVVLDFITWY